MLLDPQRILFIGIPRGTASVHTSTFFDAYNVNDFQLVAWNAETFVADTESKTGQTFGSYHHPFVYHKFKDMYEQKFAEIAQWIKSGHVLIIFPHLFNTMMPTGWFNKSVDVDVNRFPPFNLVNMTYSAGDPLAVIKAFKTKFTQFAYMLKYNIAMSGDNIVPLFMWQDCHDKIIIAGAIFRVGKGAVVFSPQPKSWSHPKLLEYLQALNELPNLLSWPIDPLDETATSVKWRAVRFRAFPAAVIALFALSPFWAPPAERLLPWGAKPPDAGQDNAIRAAQLTEMERRHSSSINIEAIKSTERALEHRVKQLEAQASRFRKLPPAPSSKVQAAPTPPFASTNRRRKQPTAFVPPTARAHLSTQEIAALLARGDDFLGRKDIASARQFYERAANAGDGRAALRLGATFDPAFLGHAALSYVHGDNSEARLWYQRAHDLGEPEAKR